MRALTIVIVLAFFGLMLLAGCPRDTSNGDAENVAQTNESGLTAQDPASDSADASADITEAAGIADEIDENTVVADGEEAEPATDADEDAGVADAENSAEGDVEQGDEMTMDNGKKDGVTTVVLETSKGDIVLEVHDDWSPLGAAHFLELVAAGFYDGAPWFRVKEGFMAQCGVSAVPALNAEWSNKTIMDEPVIVGNKPGFMAFGKTTMPNSRSTHVFINFEDNSFSLDGQGFSCFAQVVEGFDVVQQLYRCEWPDQYGLGQEGGIDKFKEAYPDADFILKAYVR